MPIFGDFLLPVFGDIYSRFSVILDNDCLFRDRTGQIRGDTNLNFWGFYYRFLRIFITGFRVFLFPIIGGFRY